MFLHIYKPKYCILFDTLTWYNFLRIYSFFFFTNNLLYNHYYYYIHFHQSLLLHLFAIELKEQIFFILTIKYVFNIQSVIYKYKFIYNRLFIIIIIIISFNNYFSKYFFINFNYI